MCSYAFLLLEIVLFPNFRNCKQCWNKQEAFSRYWFISLRKTLRSWKYERFYDLIQNANLFSQRVVLIYNATSNIRGYGCATAPLGLDTNLERVSNLIA